MNNYTEKMIKNSEMLKQIEDVWSKCDASLSDMRLFFNQFYYEASKKSFFSKFHLSFQHSKILTISSKTESIPSDWSLNNITFSIQPNENSTAYHSIKNIDLIKKINENLNVTCKINGEKEGFNYYQLTYYHTDNYAIDVVFQKPTETEQLCFFIDKDIYKKTATHEKDLEFLNLLNYFTKENDQIILEKLKTILFESYKPTEEEIDIFKISKDIDLSLLNNYKDFFINLNDFNIDNDLLNTKNKTKKNKNK